MPETVVMRAAGCSLVLDCRGPGVPRVLHWGRDLGALDESAVDVLRMVTVPPRRPSYFDVPTWLTLVPVEADGWLSAPALAGHRDGRALLPRLELVDVEATDGGTQVAIRTVDSDSGVAVLTTLRMEHAGLLRARHEVINTGDGLLDLAGAAVVMPIPGRALDVLDLTGRWSRESTPQRGRLDQGSRSRETRRGRTGHDAPTLTVAGTTDFGFGRGEVWAMHVGWSGDATSRAELLGDPPANAAGVLAGGELLRPGEVRLGPGESYRTPWIFFSWSDEGVDGASARIHAWLRSRPSHPASPRPVVLNTWEAVYFEHDLDRLRELADLAAEVGVERFVLDDGWFRHRRNDLAGLGDWYVDPDVWPQGLHPLVDHVRGLGMQMGLWVEPEMINLDSDLARAHPEWLLVAPGRLPVEWRHQHVLDLARPEAYAYLLERLDDLVTEYALDFLKWDHNRDLTEAVHAPTGQAGVHRQTLAVYALLDELRRRHPALEIESCASGGARVDLGILERTDRVWASDTNDALERQQIQRWTGLLVPPELLGSHLGPPEAHTTGRVLGLSVRAITSVFAHMGFEWDLTHRSAAERRVLAGWVDLHKELRPLLHTGKVVRADLDDPDEILHGVVAHDRGEAVYAYVRLGSAPTASVGRVPLPGLDRDRAYQLRVRGGGPELRAESGELHGRPAWWPQVESVSGGVLGAIGVQMPTMHPGEALLLHVTTR